MSEDEWTYLTRRRADIRLRTLMNRLYQQERRKRMESRENLVKLASLLAGSAAFAAVAHPGIVRWCAAVVFAGVVASLVFGWGAKARDAAQRAAEWTGLERDIATAGERTFTEAQLGLWEARCNEIETSEPAMNRGMLERAYRQACASLDITPGEDGPVATGVRLSPFVP